MSRNQRRKGGSKRGRSDAWLADARDVSTMYNAAFEQYYKGTVVPASEWDAFVSTIQRPLPVAVRVNAAAPHAEAVRQLLHTRLVAAAATASRDHYDNNDKGDGDSNNNNNNVDAAEVRVLPFYRPRGYAMQCAELSRGTLKRHARCRALKCLLAALNEGGYVSRQETVSMLPPLLLRVAPGHRVLDLCAAPGSKTCQLLEGLLQRRHHHHHNSNNNDNTSDDGDDDDDTGVVVANDLNPSRLDVLHHQTNRIAHAHRRLVMTNYDATRFPLLPPAARFDRVLCDVMCSGDGTLRKSMDLWPRWNVLQGADVHGTQCAALWRGMASCATGALLVYSTCSLNPVEDEAVVSSCLTRARGCFELVDIDHDDSSNDNDDKATSSSLLPGLRVMPGLTQWSLLTRDLSTRLHSYAEAQAYMTAQAAHAQHDAAHAQRPQRARRAFQYTESMFANTAMLQAQHMTRARRVLPHHNDTGGFFVALLRCVRALDEREGVHASSPTTTTTTTTTTAAAAAAVSDCPLRPLSDELRCAVQTALSLPDDFAYDRLLARSTVAREQKIYYATAAAYALARQLGGRVVHVGAKLFESCVKGSNERLRVSSDGAVTAAAVLPRGDASFVLDVTPRLLLDMVGEHADINNSSSSNQGTSAAVAASMSCAGGAARTGRRVDALTAYSGVLRCAHPLVGHIAVAYERPVKYGGCVLVARVLPWHVTLCRLALDLPLCAGDDAAADDDDDDADKHDDDDDSSHVDKVARDDDE